MKSIFILILVLLGLAILSYVWRRERDASLSSVGISRLAKISDISSLIVEVNIAERNRI